MSNPVWLELLILLFSPYLDVILPETGFVANFIPFTLGSAAILASSSFCSIFSCMSFLAISMLDALISSILFVYFSTIVRFSSFPWFSSFILSTTCSASSIVFTLSIFSLSRAIS